MERFPWVLLIGQGKLAQICWFLLLWASVSKSKDYGGDEGKGQERRRKGDRSGKGRVGREERGRGRRKQRGVDSTVCSGGVS